LVVSSGFRASSGKPLALEAATLAATSTLGRAMAFRITGLAPEEFSELFSLTDAQLHARDARRLVAGDDNGYPCRISLEDARAGDALILTHHQYHAVDSPFRASHAIYVRPGQQRYDRVDAVPEQLRKRLLSVRAFDRDAMLVDADVIDGPRLESLIDRLFADSRTEYLHVHFAKAGCYAARVERA
jgi:hypothetical protein